MRLTRMLMAGPESCGGRQHDVSDAEVLFTPPDVQEIVGRCGRRGAPQLRTEGS